MLKLTDFPKNTWFKQVAETHARADFHIPIMLYKLSGVDGWPHDR